MEFYGKCDTLLKRGEDFSVIGELTRPEFGIVSPWIVVEKIDGMNMSIHFDAQSSTFGEIRGRTERAQIPTNIYSVLDKWISDNYEKIDQIMYDHDLSTYTLFGEGYGAGIQSGGKYRQDQAFTLFDVKAQDSWLDEVQVSETAETLGLDRAPIIHNPFTNETTWELEHIIDLVETGFKSLIADTSAEGIVAKPLCPLYDRRGRRIMFKLKSSDFRKGK